MRNSIVSGKLLMLQFMELEDQPNLKWKTKNIIFIEV